MRRDPLPIHLLLLGSAIAGLVLLAVAAWADTGGGSPFGGNVRVVHVRDTDIDNAFEIVDADTGFTPLQANSPIRVYYHGASTDTLSINIEGIKADSTRGDTSMLVAGQEVTSTAATFMAFEQAYVDTEKASATIVYSGASSSTNRLRDIAANALVDPVAQVYSGKRAARIRSVTFAHEDNADTIDFELRVYPDIADHRDFADGYYAPATARVHANDAQKTKVLDLDLPPNSWASCWALGSTANVVGSCTIIVER